jgi:hypothetical protein
MISKWKFDLFKLEIIFKINKSLIIDVKEKCHKIVVKKLYFIYQYYHNIWYNE